MSSTQLNSVPLETDSSQVHDTSTCTSTPSNDVTSGVSVNTECTINLCTATTSGDICDTHGSGQKQQYGEKEGSADVVSANTSPQLHSILSVRSATRQRLSLSGRAISTDSESGIVDMMGWKDQRSRSLVDELLFDIYDRWHYGQRDSFDSDTITGYSSTSDAFVGRSDVIQLQLAERRHGTRLNQAFLQSKGTCSATSSDDI